MSSIRLGLIVVLVASGLAAASAVLHSASELLAPREAVAPGVEWVEVGAVSIPMGSPLPL
jgi:hypothetical protein